MKWILIVVGIIICLIAIIYIIGMLLPVKHYATVRDTVSANVDAVWNRLTDVSKFDTWRKNLNSVTITNDAEWIEISGHDKIPMKFKEKVPSKRLVAGINSKDLPFGGEWVFELEPQGNNTVVTITENGEVYNPIFRFVSKFIMGHETSLKKYMSDLKTSFQ